MGPGFAPYYLGNLGGSYQTDLVPSTFTYELPLAYVLTGYPIYIDDQDSGTFFDYSQIKIVFNKLMNPKSIQPDPTLPAPPATLKIFERTVDVTSLFRFEYNPNSETDYWGASIDVTLRAAGDPDAPVWLNPNSVYRIIGVVEDQQGNQLNVDVTILTVDPIVIATPPPAAARAK
jgi:hypothetical protein